MVGVISGIDITLVVLFVNLGLSYLKEITLFTCFSLQNPWRTLTVAKFGYYGTQW